MKRKGSWILLFVIAFNIGGVYLFFLLQRAAIRSSISRKIESGNYESHLHQLTFSASEAANLHWEHKDKEFRHEGLMYDVVSTEKINDSVIYYCIADEEETHLFAWLGKNIDNDDSALAHSALGQIIKAASALEYLPVMALVLQPDFPYYQQIRHQKPSLYTPPFTELLIPPPRQG
jgi:hypothetical protein